MNRNKDKNTTIDNIDFCKFTLQKKIICINNKQLPLNIGDKFKFNENDKYMKTIVALTVFEDGRIQYMLEWYNSESGTFETEAVTLSELKLLSDNFPKKIKNKIGF